MSDNIITTATTRANATVEKVDAQKMALINAVEGLSVTNDDELAIGVELLGDLKKRYKFIEEDRKKIVDPINQSLKLINGKYKPVKDFLEKLITRLDQDKITPYSVEKMKREREEAERRQREEFERKAREAEELAKNAEEQDSELGKEFAKEAEAEALEVADQKIEDNKTVRTETTTNTIRARWVCEIVDESKVPREFCTPSSTLLNKAVHAGVREIEGCIIKEVYSSTTR